MDLPALPGGAEGQVAGLAEVQGDAGVGEGEGVGPLELRSGLAHHAAVVGQGDLHGAGHPLRAGEQAGGGVDGTQVGAAGHRPGDLVRQGGGTAAGVHALGGEPDGAAGGVHLVGGAEGGMVKDAGLLRLGHHQQAAGYRPLIAVGGAAADGEAGGAVVIGLALTLGGEHGGAAAIQVQCVHAVLTEHDVRQLTVGHSHRVGGLAAVDHIDDHGTVSLDAHHGAGVGGVAVGAARGGPLAVLQQDSVAADGLTNGDARGLGLRLHGGAAGGDMGFICAVDPKAGGGTAFDLGAVHDEGAGGGAVAHVEEVAVDGAHHIDVPAGLGVPGLSGRLFHAPVIAGLNGRDVVVVVAHNDVGIPAQLDFHDVSGLLGAEFGVVGDELILRDIGGNGILLFGNHHQIADIVGAGRQYRGRQHACQQAEYQQQGRASLFHMHLPFVFLWAASPRAGPRQNPLICRQPSVLSHSAVCIGLL